jgi:hypothetical protein
MDSITHILRGVKCIFAQRLRSAAEHSEFGWSDLFGDFIAV